MRNWTMWLLIVSIGLPGVLPRAANANSSIPVVDIPDQTDKQKRIAELLKAIENTKNNKVLPDDIREGTLADLHEQLKPLVRDEVVALETAREIFIAGESTEVGRAALRRVYNKKIDSFQKILNDKVLSAEITANAVETAPERKRVAETAATAGQAAQPLVARNEQNTQDKSTNPVTPSASPTPKPEIRISKIPEAGDMAVIAKVLNTDTLTNPRIVFTLKENGAVRELGKSNLTPNREVQDVPSVRFAPKLNPGQTIQYDLQEKKVGSQDYESKATVEVEVFAKVNPTESGLFGMVFGGVVASRDAQTVNQAAPFAGFQIGWGSRVYGLEGKESMEFVEQFKPNVCLQSHRRWKTNIPNKLSETAPPNSEEPWTVDFYQITAPDGTAFKRNDNQDFNVNNDSYEAVTTNGSCTLEFKKRKYPFTGSSSRRYSLRLQGLFSNEGRASIARPTESPLPAEQLNRPFPFIHHRESFSPEATAWVEFDPLAQFSYGAYMTIGATTVLDKNRLADQLITDRETNLRIKSEVTSQGGTKIFGEIGSIQHLKFNPGNFLMQNFAGFGYYEAYRGAKYKFGTNQLDGSTRFRFVNKFRVFPEGINVNFGRQVTMTPMFGIDINAGAGPDNVRFFTGFAFRLKQFTGETTQ